MKTRLPLSEDALYCAPQDAALYFGEAEQFARLTVSGGVSTGVSTGISAAASPRVKELRPTPQTEDEKHDS